MVIPFMMLPIIQTKLRIPVVKDDFIRRAKLTRKMKRIPDYPLTMIHSGAGYGKSTALALFMKDESIHGCWYSISSTDDDILPFLTYIIHSIRRMVPDFGKELASYIDTIDRYIRDEELSFLCSLFINEILAVHSEITLILDDFHQIEHSYMINNWMDKLLEHIPPNLHIVVSSRSRPGWKQLTKMKVCGQLLEITKEDLVLTMEEMELLLTDLYGLQMNPGHLQTIYQMTEGWIIALCMIAQQVPHKHDLSDLFEYTSTSLQDLFQYLVMEVFSKQPPMLQQFLEQTSILEEIEEEIVDEVIGIRGASGMLEQLKERNLFIQKVGGKNYRYHALFKEFLEKEFQKNNPSNYFILNERCARFYEKRQQWEEALFHYKKIKLTKSIASILQVNGISMLGSGKLESLYDQLTFIPLKEIEESYLLSYLKAEVHRFRSHYKEAEDCYNNTYLLAEKRQDNFWMSKALEGKAKIFLDTIQPQHAERLLYEAISYREKSTSSNEEKGQLYQLLSENLLNSGKSREAEKWLQKTKESNISNLDGNLEARLYLRTGRFEEAKTVLYLQKEGLKGKSLTTLPQSHRETDLLLSLIEAFTGNGLKAKELAQAAIQQGISLKAPFVEACGWIRMGHSVQILNKYDLKLAENCYQTALEIMDQIKINRGKAEPLMGLCILFGTKGDFERALEAGKKALQETEKVHDAWLSAFITLCMSITCIYNERLQKALDYLNKTKALFEQCEDSYGLMLSSFWLSYVFYLENKQDLFKQNMDTCLSITQMQNYEFFFHKRAIFSPRDLQMIVPLLLDCTKLEIQSSYAVKILQDMGITSFESHPGYSIRVQTLGQFKIWLGEKEVGEKEWQREKAKELFQLFITMNEPISKDEITQILWPNPTRKNADRDFKVALNSLQNVLEPSRKARATPFFIIREGLFYGLNSHAVFDLDTVDFQGLIQDGLHENDAEKAIPLLEKALSLYQGEYLPERRYDDWCMSKRESMQVLFLRGAEKMAQLMVRTENYDGAINWCEKIVNRDRTWEEAYRLLMYCYYRKNNRPKAIKWYQTCTKVLEEELGVSPLEPTKHMLEMIMESEKYSDLTEQP
ncbi:BTAD domain-containing putative transcriptional regulator [Neobacillus massiliamazoniensis]|nr:BTAD domain-containing putative transcriptional regulator [Neobacillus massiliamazoniensis]